MADSVEVRQLLERLAAHPVLPPAEALPATDEAFHALVADLARGARSSQAALLQEVAAAAGLTVEELARRAQFLLACLIVPASGTHYEVLGVAPTATTREIRRRWATLIQQYHPDRLGTGNDWLAGQARRLIEAYQTLKDPDRRREYDARLARSRPAVPRPARPPRLRLSLPPGRWRWVPVGIAAVGAIVTVWATTRPAPPPLPRADLPTAPRLLESWAPVPGASERAERAPRPEPRVTASAPPIADQGPTTPPEEIPLLSLLRDHLSRRHAPQNAPVTLPAKEPAPAATTPPPVEPPAPPKPESAAAVERTPPGRELARLPEESRQERPLVSPLPLPAPGPSPASQPAAPPAPRPSSPRAEGSPAEPPPQESITPTPQATVPPAGPPVPAAPSPKVTPQATPSVETPPAPSSPAPPVGAAAPKPASPPATPPPAVVTPASPTSEPAPVARQVASPSTPEVPSTTEIFALIDRFRQAYERKDLGSVMALLGSDPRDRKVRGRAAVEQLYATNFSGLRDISYQLTRLRVQEPQSDGRVVVEGRFRIRAARNGWFWSSQPVDVSGPIRWTLRREAGQFRIVSIDYEAAPR